MNSQGENSQLRENREHNEIFVVETIYIPKNERNESQLLNERYFMSEPEVAFPHLFKRIR